eukprot:CAMPEP_0114237806 /NCGR_PEP_ID=MMETSP0058-20121206/7587_1 /TAXON_ID=36894 /ORGANISM="Pyramimonas parkeae, CCMP726" /LENGTH=761 /DNA_ID=CAMNT_0001349873 /DNA_START=819 /DNA_END=3104 /DNA_ORIENTATION=+
MTGFMDQTLTFVRPYLSLTTPKLVRIRDMRLGLMLMCLRLGVFVLVFAQTWLQRSYLSEDVATVVQSIFTEAANFTQVQKSELENFGNEEVGTCGPDITTKFDFSWSDALNYDIDACSLLPKAVLATKLQTMQGVFINTMTRNGVTQRVEAPKSDMTPAECKAYLLSLGDSCTPRIGSLDVSSPMLEDILSRVVYSYNPGALGWSYLAPDLSNGTCQCNLVSSAVHSGAEELAIRLMKSVQADGVSIPSEVPTYVRIQGASHGDFVYKFAADENVRFTVKQVLDWLELDLDLPVNKQPTNKWTPEEANAKMALQGPKNFGVNDNFPMLRITGVRVLAKLQYYNEGMAKELKGTDSGEDDVAILTLLPNLGWTSLEDDVETLQVTGTSESTKNTYRYGVSLEFEGAGVVYKVDYNLVLTKIIDGVVMMNMVSIAVQYFAMYGMGVRSMLYKELIEESVTIISQYARFVIQALTSALVFKMLDTDESGQIDSDELFETVTSIFAGRLNSKEVSCLVDVAIDASKEEQIKGLEQVLIEMREVSRMEHKAMMEGTPQVKKEIKTMNLQEFVRVFTGPPCTIPGCSALTQQLQARADETNTKKMGSNLSRAIWSKRDRSTLEKKNKAIGATLQKKQLDIPEDLEQPKQQAIGARSRSRINLLMKANRRFATNVQKPASVPASIDMIPADASMSEQLSSIKKSHADLLELIQKQNESMAKQGSKIDFLLKKSNDSSSSADLLALEGHPIFDSSLSTDADQIVLRGAD